jgi:hypothetical protein
MFDAEGPSATSKTPLEAARLVRDAVREMLDADGLRAVA